MKQINWALATLIVASGSATARVETQAPYIPADGGSPSVEYRIGTDAWARHVDFATASGMAPAPNWEPLGAVDFGRPPAPALVPDSAEPISLPANPAGTALAENIAVENNLVNGLINVQQVPEPSAWLMMLAGVGAIAFVIRRRNGESNG
jgi:hypothetical protein